MIGTKINSNNKIGNTRPPLLLPVYAESSINLKFIL